jgi:hypothetical protein
MLLLLALLAFLWLPGLKGMAPHGYRAALMAARAATAAKAAVLRYEKWRAPEAEPRAPSKSKQRTADSGAALQGFIYALHHPPLSFSRSLSFVATPPPHPSPSRFPSKRGAALPSFSSASPSGQYRTVHRWLAGTGIVYRVGVFVVAVS